MDDNITETMTGGAVITAAERLEMLAVGEGVRVSFDLCNSYRNAASRMKMKGMKFRTKMVEGGLEVWRMK